VFLLIEQVISSGMKVNLIQKGGCFKYLMK